MARPSSANQVDDHADARINASNLERSVTMIARTDRKAIVVALAATVLAAACVKKSTYEALEAQNRQLQQKVATQSAQIDAERAQVGRLQGAIKYTVDSDLLFAPGSWEMRKSG